MSDNANLQLYTLFVNDTARFSERRQTVSNIYVGVNSLLLVAIGLLIKDLAVRAPWTLLLLLPLVVAGIMICLWWRQLIRKYKALVGLRIDRLRKMEDDLPEPVRMFHAEDELYPRDAEGAMVPGEGLNFSDLEARLPTLFIVLYCILGAGSMIALIFRIALALVYRRIS